MKNPFAYVREQKARFETTDIHVPGLGDWNQKNHIELINAGWADSYLPDDAAFDEIIGDYPYENIHKAPTLLEARATDFDQKHIEVEAKDGSRYARIAQMIANKALQQHMEDIRLGVFFNQVSYVRAKYGGVRVGKEGENIVVKKWEQMITDQGDIMLAPDIERYYLSPSQILAMKAWDNTLEAVKTADNIRYQEIAEAGASDDVESTGDSIEVYVIEGDLPLSMLKQAQAIRDNKVYDELEDDYYTYRYSRIILCGANWNVKDKDEKNHEQGIVFYAEEEDVPLRKYLARNPIAGRGLGEAVPEVLFESQRWWNKTKTEELRMMAIAGKKLYITDDPDILANIFDEGVDHGTVLRLSQGKTFTELNQIPTGTPVYQSMRAEMFNNVQRLTSSFSAVIGEEAKSGTPFRSQYLQNIEASSQFEQYREEMGFFYKEIIEDWVLPDALRKASKKDEIYATFTPQELQLIDEVIVEKQTIDDFVQATLEGKVITPEKLEEMRAGTQRQLRKSGNKRTIQGIQEFIKNAGKHVRIHTTDEARNKAVLFESYSNLLRVLTPEDPRFTAVVDKIMQAIGITKEELEIYADQTIQAKSTSLQGEQLQAQGQPAAQTAMAKI